MKMLCFDTSGPVLSAAVFDGERKLAAHEAPASNRQSEMLAPFLQKIVRSAKLDMKKIECIAVGLGPGSFTGLRIGVMTAKTMAYALKARLIGVSSLEAMARGSQRDGTFAAIADARRSQVYAAVYRRKNNVWKTLRQPALYPREDFLNSLDRDTTLLESAHPSAVAIAQTALESIRRKRFDDPFSLNPHYLRPKDCNVSKK